jgi:hypothetical protein
LRASPCTQRCICTRTTARGSHTCAATAPGLPSRRSGSPNSPTADSPTVSNAPRRRPHGAIRGLNFLPAQAPRVRPKRATDGCRTFTSVGPAAPPQVRWWVRRDWSPAPSRSARRE